MDTEILEYEDLEAFFKTIDSNFDSNTDEKDMLILYELTGLMLQGDDEIDDNEITSSGQSKVSAKKVQSDDLNPIESEFAKSLLDDDVDKSPFIINP